MVIIHFSFRLVVVTMHFRIAHSVSLFLAATKCNGAARDVDKMALQVQSVVRKLQHRRCSCSVLAWSRDFTDMVRQNAVSSVNAVCSGANFIRPPSPTKTGQRLPGAIKKPTGASRDR